MRAMIQKSIVLHTRLIVSMFISTSHPGCLAFGRIATAEFDSEDG